MIPIFEIDDYLTGEVEHICRMPCPNKFVHHYSKLDSILSILETKCIWLMHFSHMNDSSEGKLILENSIGNKSDSRKIKELLLENYYICCFSNYGNLLSQWRAYGDINIGFDRKSFEAGKRLIEDKNSEKVYTSGVHFSDCNYINEKDKEFNQAIEKVKSHLNCVHNPPDINDQYHLLTAGLICFSNKHSGFKEEAESRLFEYLWGIMPFKYESRKYVKYKFEESQVKRIVVGPSSNQELNIEKIQYFIKNHPKYRKVKIYVSKIPFIDMKVEQKNALDRATACLVRRLPFFKRFCS